MIMSIEFESATHRNKAGDLVGGKLPDCSSLSAIELPNHLFRWIEESALSTINWYLTEKVPKAKKSRWLRVLAIVLAALGSVAPFVAVGLNDPRYAFLGYPILGAAAAAIGADRALGLSSSWTRYQLAAASIGKIVVNYQLNWAIALRAPIDSDESIESRLNIVRQFASAVNDVVLAETQSWVTEFQSYLSQLESSTNRLN